MIQMYKYILDTPNVKYTLPNVDTILVGLCEELS